MADAEQRKPEGTFFFKGKKLDCKTQYLGSNLFLYDGYWNYLEDMDKANQRVKNDFVKSKDRKQKKEAAIRRIKNEECLNNWKNVADKLIKLNHNNILRVFGYEEDIANGWRYFALEPYNATLFHYCTGEYKGPVPNESQVLYQITNGLDFLHGNQIIHGNVTPSSIVIAAQSLPVRMKISDFGFSKFSYGILCSALGDASSSVDERLELCQSKYWTLSEQFNDMGKHVNDDIVAAACILFYYLKRGKHLFGNDPQSVLLNLKEKNPANLKHLDEDHVAFEPIQNMIIPQRNGFNWLRIANDKFKEALFLKVDRSKPLGKGTFGDVFEGKYEGDAVAVKQMTTTTSQKEIIQREMNKHMELDHVNVVKLFDVMDSADNGFTHMALELCAGTLTDYCEKKYNGPMPPDELVLYQIANGLHYIHSRDLVHRDIKPDNILISMTTPVQMKVSDLSFVKQTRKDIFSQSKIRGTLLWMAPEMLQILNDSDKKLESFPDGTIKSDTFSSGCVFFYLLSRGKHPFGNEATAPANILQNKPAVEFVSYQKNLAIDNVIGRILAGVIEGMIKKEEEERIGLPEVIKQLATLLSAGIDEIECRFRHVELPAQGHTYNRFHPTKPILACANDEGLIFYAAENSSIPFSNWRKKVKFLSGNLVGNSEMSLEWNINGTQLAAGYDDGTLVVLNYPQCDIVFQKKHSNGFHQIEWNPIKRNVLATFYETEKHVLIWNSSTGDVINKIDCGRVCAVKWISENRIAVASTSDRAVIQIFEMDENHSITTTRIVKQMSHGSSCELEWNERTQFLASFGGCCIKIWSMDSDEPIYSLELETTESIDKFAWRPCVRNGRQDDDGIEMERKSPENFTLVYTIRRALVNNRFFTWIPLRNEQKPQLLSDKSEILNLTFSSDGRFLATAHYDGIIIWSAEDWIPIVKFSNVDLESVISWLSTPTATNLYQNKLICQSSYFGVPLFEFAFEENENSDSATRTLIESEEDTLGLK